MPSLLDGFLGQQKTPTFSNPGPNEVLAQILGHAPQIAQGNVDYNSIYMPGMARVNRQVEDIYDPNRANIRTKAGSLLAAELNDPYAVPQGLKNLWRNQGFEGARGGIGGGLSEANINNVFSTMGEKAGNWAQNLITQGLNYGNLQTGMVQPEGLGITPGDMGNAYLGQQAQQNNWERYKTELNAQNARNLISMPLNYISQVGQIGGAIAGAVMGTNMGGMAGGMMGGGGGGGTPTAPVAMTSYGQPIYG